MERKSKSKWKSRTIWFSVGSLLVNIGTQFAFIVEITPLEYRIAATILLSTLTAIGTIILRMLTTEPVE